MNRENILEVNNLTKSFDIKKGLFLKKTGEVRAVDSVSFNIEKGSTFGLVGESGSGKSTIGRCLVRLVQPNNGTIFFKGKDILKLNNTEFKKIKKDMQIVFQDPLNSLDPRFRVEDILKESILLLDKKHSPSSLDKRIYDLLGMVNLSESLRKNFPHQISGGQAQRLCIARALCGNPNLLILDEPTSGLDITTVYNLINLLISLQRNYGISYLFITHDLKIAKKICSKIAVMFQGKIVEEKDSKNLFLAPSHNYTKKLLQACLF